MKPVTDRLTVSVQAETCALKVPVPSVLTNGQIVILGASVRALHVMGLHPQCRRVVEPVFGLLSIFKSSASSLSAMRALAYL